MQPPSAVATDNSLTISSVVNGSALEMFSNGTLSNSPPSVLTSSVNSTSSSPLTSSPASSASPSTPNCDALVSSHFSSAIMASTSPTSALSPSSTPTAAAAVAASMITPLRELNNYLAKLEEDKGKLYDENEKLHDVKDKLHSELLTYSQFNCILENIRHSFDKGFTALQVADQNKSCRCNEHLNLNLRRIVQEAEMELELWQKQYDKLVYKYQAENGGSPGSAVRENPLRHHNAALIGANGALLFQPSVMDVPAELLPKQSNGFSEANSELMNGSRGFYHERPPSAKPSLGKIAESSSFSEPEQCHSRSSSKESHSSSPAGNSMLNNGLSHKGTNGSMNNGSSVLKSSYDLSAAINFSTASFLKSEKPDGAKPQHFTNGHHHFHHLDDDEPITPPPLIPPPPPPSYEPSKRLNGEANWSNASHIFNGHNSHEFKDRRVVSEAQLNLKQSEKKFDENAERKAESPLKSEDDEKDNIKNKDNECKEKHVSLEEDELMNRELSAIAKSVEKKEIRCNVIIDDEEGLKDSDSVDMKKDSGATDSSASWECEWPDCTQLFDSEEILILHRRCHIRKSNYLCKHCSARMLSREELEQHVATCEQTVKNERKASFCKSRNSSDTSSNASNDEAKNSIVSDKDADSPSSERERKDKSKESSGKRKNIDFDAHSSEEEIEVEEVSVLNKFSRTNGAEHHLKPSSLEPSAKDVELLNGGDFITKQSASRRSSSASNDDIAYARYADLLYPSKRQKAFTISTPSYMPHHLASLSAFYPHLAGQNGISSSGSSPLSPHHSLMSGNGVGSLPPGMNPLELSALMESGRISPLTLSMLASQHHQNQHRFQQYFLQQHLQVSGPGSGGNAQSPGSPPASPTGAENLTMPNSVRSSSFSSGSSVASAASGSGANGSPFYRSSSISGLMGPPVQGPKHTSGRILSAALSPSQQQQSSDRLATSPSGVLNGFSSHHHPSSSSHPLFSPQGSGGNSNGSHGPSGQSPTILSRSYTISTPGSFSALAALAAAATSSAPSTCSSSSSNGGDRSVPSHHNGLHFPMNTGGTGGHLHSSLHSSPPGANGPKLFGSAFDLHHRSSNGSRHSPLGSPVSNGTHSCVPTSAAGQSLHHRNLASIYGGPGGPAQNGLGPHPLNGTSHLINSTSSQGQLAMIAAAAAAAADNARHAQSLGPQMGGGLANGNASEASRLTAAALASLGALKHQSMGPGPPSPAVGEYKRTRYSGIGRYRCPWPDCGYTPHFLRDLRRHMFKHTGDKKHKCDYPGCDFVSVWKTSLLQHQRKKHYGVSSSISLRNNHQRNGNAATCNPNGINGGMNNGNGPNDRRSPPPPNAGAVGSM